MEINRNLWTKSPHARPQHTKSRDFESRFVDTNTTCRILRQPQPRNETTSAAPNFFPKFSQLFSTEGQERLTSPRANRADSRHLQTDSAQTRRHSHTLPMNSQQDFPYLSHKIPNPSATLRNQAHLTAWPPRARLLGYPYPSTGLLETTWACLTRPPRPP